MKTIKRFLLLSLFMSYSFTTYALLHLKCVPQNGGTITKSGTPTAEPNEGYKFVKWELRYQGLSEETIKWTTTSNPSDRKITVDQNNCCQYDFLYYTLIAYFEEISTYTISTSTTNGGTITGAGTYNENASVTLTAIPEDCYEFKQWSDGNQDNPRTVTATQDVTYTAEFEKIQYAIIFNNFDGAPLQNTNVDCGTTPTYTGETPTKSADAQYTYVFSGWTPELVEVTGEATYAAQYSSTLNKYAISFVNYDGTPLQSGELEYGTMPAYTGETPTRPADDENTYTFSGWTPAVVAVTGNTTYTATFQSVPFVKYTITWQDEDGNVIKTDQVAQDATPAFTGTTPTKEGYTFAGWLPNIKPATEDTKYTTYFIPTQQQESKVYTVNINGENCSLNINNQYPEGTVITLEAVADECFEFQQWSDGNKDNPRTVTVTKDMSLTAEFNKVRYTVTGEPSTGGKVQIRKQ